jgi:hypothetical protein
LVELTVANHKCCLFQLSVLGQKKVEVVVAAVVASQEVMRRAQGAEESGH